MSHITNGKKDSQILAILYEHPEWFKPLFAEFERRGLAYERQLAHQHHFDPAERSSPYALVVNRMSPSAYTRGHDRGIQYSLNYLAYLKDISANVVNGYDAFVYELSKAQQLNLFEKLGLNYPRAIVINHARQALAAAEQIGFPLIVKPNVGGSGAGIQAFTTKEELAEVVDQDAIDLGPQQVALVQAYLPARGDSIVRVEILNGEFLYAIRLFLEEGTFNLCPADYCLVPDASPAEREAARNALVQGFTPPEEIIEQVKRITAAANIDVGGVEYLINDQDGQPYFYDINALSNFVADAPEVVGFDPFPKLVDFLQTRAGIGKADAQSNHVSIKK
jgi:glutathione synthase/RimK-type ligase-like ATP-grasp enzyme